MMEKRKEKNGRKEKKEKGRKRRRGKRRNSRRSIKKENVQESTSTITKIAITTTKTKQRQQEIKQLDNINTHNDHNNNDTTTTTTTNYPRKYSGKIRINNNTSLNNCGNNSNNIYLPPVTCSEANHNILFAHAFLHMMLYCAGSPVIVE